MCVLGRVRRGAGQEGGRTLEENDRGDYADAKAYTTGTGEQKDGKRGSGRTF